MNNICVFCENWQPDAVGMWRKKNDLAAFPRLCRNMKLSPITEEWETNRRSALDSLPPRSRQKVMIACACTPWGKPPADWKPV
jgi:hypothetical protein